MFNQLVLAAVTPFNGTNSTDKNGKDTVMLQCIAGQMPNRNVLAGTVAENMGIKIGHTYLLDVREQGEHVKFGKDYTFIKVKEIDSALDIVKTAKELGDPIILTVGRPDLFKEEGYERKTDAVEGLRTKLIREGLYKPATATTVTNHETASRVVDGTSVTGDATDRFNAENSKKETGRDVESDFLQK